MRVGERAKVVGLNRPTKQDREAWMGREGLVMRRLNVAWEAEHGDLWELRFDAGDVVVFSASELAVVRNGREEPVDMGELKESWGKAPRVASFPFRKFGSGVGAAPAVLAILVFALAGVLLLWAGVAEDSWALGIAGGLLVLIGVGTAGVLIT
ncbi:MAG: hypothetical protein WD826_11435 [Actinomycetota bacterium]